MYIQEKELAARLQVNPHTLRQWRKLNKGPAYFKIGGAVRYTPEDIESWLQKNRHNG